MALVKCPCAFRLRRLAQNVCRGIGVRHFSCNFRQNGSSEMPMVHVRFDCAGSHKMLAKELLSGHFPRKFSHKPAHVHFDCGGSHKVCFPVLGSVFLFNIILLNIIIFLLVLNIHLIIIIIIIIVIIIIAITIFIILLTLSIIITTVIIIIIIIIITFIIIIIIIIIIVIVISLIILMNLIIIMTLTVQYPFAPYIVCRDNIFLQSLYGVYTYTV